MSAAYGEFNAHQWMIALWDTGFYVPNRLNPAIPELYY